MALLKPLFLPGPPVPEGEEPDEEFRYSAQDVRRLVGGVSTEGVVYPADGSFRVGPRAQGVSRVIQVAPGRAHIDGDNSPAQGTYFVQSTAVEELTVAANPPSGSRRDLVVIEVRDGSVSGADHDWRLRLVQGTVASGAPVPAVPLSAIPLAVIGPITSTTGSITGDLISDLRFPARAYDAASLGGHLPSAYPRIGPVATGGKLIGTYAGQQLRVLVNSAIVTTNSNAAFNADFGGTFTGGLIAVFMQAASTGASFGIVRQIESNHTLYSGHGQAYTVTGGALFNTGPLRVSVQAVGWDA